MIFTAFWMFKLCSIPVCRSSYNHKLKQRGNTPADPCRRRLPRFQFSEKAVEPRSGRKTWRLSLPVDHIRLELRHAIESQTVDGGSFLVCLCLSVGLWVYMSVSLTELRYVCLCICVWVDLCMDVWVWFWLSFCMCVCVCECRWLFSVSDFV